jgi:hypothetical protein
MAILESYERKAKFNTKKGHDLQILAELIFSSRYCIEKYTVY